MQRTGNENNDIEIIDTYFEILDLIVSTYSQPLQEGFKSRCEQLGYNLLMLTASKGVIAPGEVDPQMRIDTEQEGGSR